MSFCVQQTVGVGRWAGVFPGLMGREGWREEMTAGEKWAMKHDEDVHLVPSPGPEGQRLRALNRVLARGSGA